MKRIVLILFFIFSMFTYAVYGEYEMDFVNIPVDAYSAGLGGYKNFSISSDNLSYLYNIKENRISFSHAFLFSSNSSIDGVSLFLPLAGISLSMNFVYYLVKDIPLYSEEYDSLQPSQPDSFFNVYGTIYSFGLAYHREVKNAIFSGGIKTKYVYEDLLLTQGTFSSLIPSFTSTFMVNRNNLKYISLTIVCDNFMKTSVLWTKNDTVREEKINRDIEIGGNILWNLSNIKTEAITYFSYSFNRGLYIGFMCTYNESVSVFSGYSNEGWGGGVSIFMWNIGISYGYMLVEAGSTHRLTMEIKW